MLKLFAWAVLLEGVGHCAMRGGLGVATHGHMDNKAGKILKKTEVGL